MKINSIVFPQTIDPLTLETVIGVMVEAEHNGEKHVGRVRVPRSPDSAPPEARAHLLRTAAMLAIEQALDPLMEKLPLYQTTRTTSYQLDLEGSVPAVDESHWALRGAKEFYPEWPVVLTCDNCGRKHRRYYYIETYWCDDCINGDD